MKAWATTYCMIAFFSIFGCSVAFADDATIELRKWKSSDGKYTIEAKLVEVKSGVVWLRRSDGERISVPYNRLSDADQRVVKSFIKASSASRRRPDVPEKGRPDPGKSAAKIVDKPALIEIPKSDEARIKLAQETRLWQKMPIDKVELTKILNQLRSADPDDRKHAMTVLAVSKPDPAWTQAVMDAVNPVRGTLDEDFYKKVVIQIKTSWEAIKIALPFLEEAQRTGPGVLQQPLKTGKLMEKSKSVQALMFLSTAEAAEVMVDNRSALAIGVGKPLMEMGPVAAPAVARLLKSADRKDRKMALDVLKEIGTSAELPAMRELVTDPDGIVRIAASRAVEAVEESGR